MVMGLWPTLHHENRLSSPLRRRPATSMMFGISAPAVLRQNLILSSAKTASSTLGDDVCASRDKPDLNTRGMRVGVRPGDSRRLHPDIGSAKE
jgi:hypothetical protein